jgi:hypothetical protein
MCGRNVFNVATRSSSGSSGEKYWRRIIRLDTQVCPASNPMVFLTTEPGGKMYSSRRRHRRSASL